MSQATSTDTPPGSPPTPFIPTILLPEEDVALGPPRFFSTPFTHTTLQEVQEVPLYMSNPPGSPDFPPTPHLPTIPLPNFQDVVLFADHPPVVLHTLLSIEPGRILYDFGAPVSEGLTPGSRELALDVYATEPPVSSIKIICQPLGKELMILPGEPITVLQVITWIHKWLHEPISDADYLDLDPIQREWIDATYYHRCSIIEEPRTRETEFQEGRKAIDALCGLRVFGGLFNMGDGMTFELLLDTCDEVM
jgi:hypothetical protein